MKNQQQNQLKKDMSQPDKTITFADKSSYMSQLAKEHQHQHIKKQTATSRKKLKLKENKLWKM